MEPVLIGYFPKRTLRQPEWLKAGGIVEVCSTSHCISKGPEDWINHWRHNDMWVYDTPELAWSIVPEPDRPEFDLYAYELFPVKFTAAGQQPYDLPPIQPQPLSADFAFLGYDAVSRSCDNSFECSPLSCNHMAKQIFVNPHCLFADAETAFTYAVKFDGEHCEPGPYYVVKVWRLKR